MNIDEKLIENIISRKNDENLEFLKKTTFKKVSFISFDEYNHLLKKHLEEDSLGNFIEYLTKIQTIPVEGQTEFTFYEVVADYNIVSNDDGRIYTNSNYIYEFDDISEIGCVGTWSIIQEIIECIS
jgi:CRISPR/Cas system CSM-associated protein Csm4 (group 5 of RAMP superfamily)